MKYYNANNKVQIETFEKELDLISLRHPIFKKEILSVKLKFSSDTNKYELLMDNRLDLPSAILLEIKFAFKLSFT